MDNIIEPTIDFDFNNLYLGVPISQPASTYLTRIIFNNKALFIQAPKCISKNGFVKVGKKIYCDLMFTNEDTIIIDWMEKLENKCQELLFVKRESWFESEMTKEDIETSFSSPFKIYKSGKYYILRVNVKPNIKIFNENGNEIAMEEVKPESTMISILDIHGIKFTARNFQMEIELKQSMVVSPDPFLDACLIRQTNSKPVAMPEENISKIVNKILETRQNNVEPLQIPEPKIEKSFIPLAKPEIFDPPKIEESEPIKEESESIIKSPLLDFQPDTNELMEFDLNIHDNLETISLKDPKQVYYDLYHETMEKAKIAKEEYKKIYLEAQNIKDKYMLNIESDEDSDFDFESGSDF